jgi:tRNA 5-methylaminomethyl-2-thiouridine biosynthesis bifunctional protein
MRQQGDIRWKEDGTPYSHQFDDVYFSEGSGPGEVEHVFLKPNLVQQRLQEQDQLAIAELGFGTGLNFLMTWQMHEAVNSNSTLHFYSVEKYPMTLEQLSTSHEFWPGLSQFSQTLLQQVKFETGWNVCSFDQVTLHLYIGDVQDFLDEMNALEATVDAWFLDGFAPSKNPDMWSLATLTKVGQISKSGTTFSTYTVVGQVRRDLMTAGFDVKKIPGYGKKREMLFGKM